jgi:hypothetical protein
MENFSKTLTKSLIENRQVNQSTIQSNTCTNEPTLPCLIADVAIENNQVALIMATAIAISIVIYAVSKSAAEIIKALRKEGE